MDGKKNTQQQIDDVLETASQIEVVHTSPFFKDKVLHRLTEAGEAEESSELMYWFTAKYQIAVLLLFAVLNIVAIYSHRASNQQEQITAFAEAFGLSNSENESILN
ncbi:MAG: hypothetical protein AB3N18_09665 [Allomuricauda sp.]